MLTEPVLSISSPSVENSPKSAESTVLTPSVDSSESEYSSASRTSFMIFSPIPPSRFFSLVLKSSTISRNMRHSSSKNVFSRCFESMSSFICFRSTTYSSIHLSSSRTRASSLVKCDFSDTALSCARATIALYRSSVLSPDCPAALTARKLLILDDGDKGSALNGLSDAAESVRKTAVSPDIRGDIDTLLERDISLLEDSEDITCPRLL
mmetsp:Transcript_1165/g.1892  ORF Transcript_1165/g.1892 Transcript_1165/m.1892 type:complete len:209 (-) Transcript_1165:3629-4255(-)